MCGFAGFIAHQDFTSDAENLLHLMGQKIMHRGPDDAGIWFSQQDKIGLVHQRLSIVDLSEQGYQPMKSHCGDYILAFNGEIYNHQALREQLTSCYEIEWRGHSDTETLLELIAREGIELALKSVVGMFAFALWHISEKTLVLARDRIGEKPLYFSDQSHKFYFASELKALAADTDFKCDISRDSLSLLLRHNYIPCPYSIYKGVYKLTPGYYLTYKAGRFIQTQYWDAIQVFNQEKNAHNKAKLHKQLLDTISKQMLADVPVGAFLSGGIDSSLVSALMQSCSSSKIKTFSIGFTEEDYNEAPFAKAVAAHLGTDHYEHHVSAEDAINVVDDLASIYDEPFADSSQIPTFLVAKFAKQHVTVCLSGDGGDELFCGYNRYLFANRIWMKLRLVPRFLREAVANVLKAFPQGFWRYVKALFFFNKKIRLTENINKLACIIKAKTIDELYIQLVSHCDNPEQYIHNAKEPKTVITDSNKNPKLPQSIEQLMALDTLSYLPDDILVKVDRASMANSLEVRVPFLDHKIIDIAWSLPIDSKLTMLKTKSCLRDILIKYVPNKLIERPKTGFGIPLDEWLRGPLKNWAETYLNADRLNQEGFFKVGEIRKIWHEHLTGKKNRQYLIWNVLMFQLWFEKHHK